MRNSVNTINKCVGLDSQGTQGESERREKLEGRGRGKRERGQKKGSEIENNMSNTHQLKSATYDFQKLTTC